MKQKDLDEVQTSFDSAFEKASSQEPKNKEKVNETVIPSKED